jgi:hypothetical protein
MSESNSNGDSRRNRKGKQVYAGIAALTVSYWFACYVGADNATYVTFATALCALCGTGLWANVKEHQAKAPGA